MYKAVIIDDDPIVRKGMTMMIDWNSLGFTICATARDGEEGLEIINQCQPDLVITDIQMPGLNGLEMVDDLKDSFPDLEVIIITGFRNFDYARQALKLGVREILLKPTRLEELVNAVNLVIGELKEKELLKIQRKIQEKEDQQHKSLMQQRLLADLALGLRRCEDSCREELRKQGIPESSFLLFVTECFSDNQDNMISSRKAVVQIFKDFSHEGLFFLPFRQDKTHTVFLALFRNEELAAREELRDILGQGIAIIKANLGISLTAAISSAGRIWNDLREKYQEAMTLMEMTFLYGRGKILEKPSFAGKSISEKIQGKQEKRLLKLIKEGDREELKSFLTSECFSFYHEGGEREIKRFYSNLIHRIHEIRQSYQLPHDDEWKPVTWIDRIMHAETADEVQSLLVHYSLASAEEIFCVLNQGKVDYVDKAKEFLKQNFHQDITLQQVSEYVCVSSYYLSRLFTQNEGISFSNYLNQLRIDEAKKLFFNTELKSFEIGERVGIHDPYYFSKLFKKIEGVSPSQYKKVKL